MTPPVSRRAALSGLAATSLVPTSALSADPSRHPGFAPWQRVPRSRGDIPLNAPVRLASGEQTLKAWFDGRPTVLVLWASWCGPCLADKPGQARMVERLAAAGSRTRVVTVRAFDDASDRIADWRLKRLGVGHIENARATEAFEAAMLKWFGRSEIEPDRTPMPSLALISGRGRAIGWNLGRLFTDDDEDWWELPRAFDFLNSLT